MLRHGGEPSSILNDADQTSSSCNFAISAVNGNRQPNLGIRIETEDYENLAITCECSATYEPIGSASNPCFSGSSLVQVQGKGDVLMKDLQVGDYVLTGKNSFEQVYSFGHRHEDLSAEFYQIHTEQSKKPLEMTANHLLFVDNQAVRADSVKVGDQLTKATGESVKVTKISTTTKAGLYMPLTADGTIAVEGLVASSYVSIKDDAPTLMEQVGPLFGLTEHSGMHWWLSPYRMMCMGVSAKYCEGNNHNEEGILNWLILGQDLVQFFEPLGFGLNVLASVPFFLVFGLFNMSEVLLGGPALAPLMMAAIGLVAAYGISSRREAASPKKVN